MPLCRASPGAQGQQTPTGLVLSHQHRFVLAGRGLLPASSSAHWGKLQLTPQLRHVWSADLFLSGGRLGEGCSYLKVSEEMADKH